MRVNVIAEVTIVVTFFIRGYQRGMITVLLYLSDLRSSLRESCKSENMMNDESTDSLNLMVD